MTHPWIVRVAHWIKYHPGLVPPFLWFWAVGRMERWHEEREKKQEKTPCCSP